MEYGSHMGEYIRQKLEERGTKLSWVADKVGSHRQNFPRNYLEKAELKPSQILDLERILGRDFFTEFYQNNPELKDLVERIDPAPAPQEPPKAKSGSGYRIHIEIDPENFDPQNAEALGLSLRNALEEYEKKTSKPNSGRNQDENEH